MRIPDSEEDLRRFLQFVIENCTSSQQQRRALYDKRRRYFLYGQNKEQMVKFNRLKSHLPLLASFLFSADQVAYSVTAPPNSDERTIAQYQSIEDEWNQDFQDYGLAQAFDHALLWSIIYDTMVLKVGWNDITSTAYAMLIEPSQFGVMREDQWQFDNQQAMVYSYIIPWDEAVERLLRAGMRNKIEQLTTAVGDAEMGLPGTLNQMIISATGGANIQGNIQGEVNPDYEEVPKFTARIDQPMVRFHNVWVFDSECQDWREFEVSEPDLILTDSKKVMEAYKRAAHNKYVDYESHCNLFLPKQHPFTVLTPYSLYNYFWGDCHMETLIPLQLWSTERLNDIGEILEQQVDPPKAYSGFMGLDDERAEALGAPGTYVIDQMPNAKVDMLRPPMPEDLFVEFNEIGQLFMEQSGFTEIMSGKGEKNVRGKQHAEQLSLMGGGRVKKIAAGLEEPLIRLADLGLRLKARNDKEELKTADGLEFVLAQVLDGQRYQMRIAGHSHSPLFTMRNEEIAAALFKAQAIDQEWFIRLLRPPQEQNLLHALRTRRQAMARAAEERAKRGLPPVEAPKRGGRPKAVA